jgi:hypothetical protein
VEEGLELDVIMVGTGADREQVIAPRGLAGISGP